MFRLYFFIIFYYLKHWTQQIQSYNYASQSMWGSQRIEIDPSEEFDSR